MEERKKLAFKLCLEAREILLRKFNDVRNIAEKSANDYVTDADLKIEKYLIDSISAKFKQDTIISEEKGTLKGNTEFKWIIDPLDGTNNYLRGISLAGMQMAILKDEKPLFGILLDPFMNEIYYAEKGKGAFKTDIHLKRKIKIQVSDRSLDNAMVVFSSSLTNDKGEEQIKVFKKILPLIGSMRMFGVAIRCFPFIAQGSTEAIISFIPKSYDIAAGSLLVEEAGGKITTFDGKPWFPDMPNLVASNSKIHNELVGILKKTWKNQ